MKKSGALILFLIIIFSLVPQLIAENETIDAESINENVSTTSNEDSNKERIEKGFECLEDKAKNCKSLSTQEIALTILATPDNIFDDCVDELLKKESNDNWGNVRDTALAILALQHAGLETEEFEEWLLSKSRNPNDLVWYMQQDSNSEVECNIKYKTEDYNIKVSENKKIDKNAGSCLTLAQSNFWLRIASDCYDEKYIISCNQNFIANLLYKDQNSPTIYVLEGTQSAASYGSIELEVKSKCFGDNSCDYEATVWTTLALLATGHDIEEYIPYIIAMSQSNKKYLPEAFIYSTTNYEDYARKLMESQKLGDYWEAQGTAYNRFYDTSIALLSIGQSSSEQVTKAKDWLLFSQGSNGCWQNSVRETAIVLWALVGKAGRSSTGQGSSITYCSEAGYFCVPNSDCPQEEILSGNYYCPSLSNTCCLTENLKSCSEYSGSTCSSEEVCIGNERKATDTTNCCTGTCTPKSTTTECEDNYYVCRDSCSDDQEEISYSCSGNGICCRTKTSGESGSKLWIWILILLIIIILGAIAWIKREELKLWWFKMKSKFKKEKDNKGPSSPSSPRPGMPPSRPGFPPIRRPMQMPSRNSNTKKDPHMDETFSKLREIARK